jgi:ATP-dependent RNA helicase RhlE
MDFTSLGLSPQILKAVQQQGYSKPSPIQAQAIPPIIAGEDVMAAAQTGTGKTAGFTLPILEKLLAGKSAGANQARVLVLTPTRELAAQVHESVKTYGRFLSLKSTVVFGGVKINPQMMRLRRGVDILVATPGRLLDLCNQGAVRFDQLEVLVLDEADRMLDMGFIHDIRKIIAMLPKKRQTLMFSATFSEDIRQLAKSLVDNPVEISVNPRNTTVEAIKQRVLPVDKKKKPALLAHLIKKHQWSQVLVFTKTKHGANRLTKFLTDKGISAVPIHGNKSQAARTKALDSFKKNTVQVLVATDIAARGIDIHLLPHVVNFDLPHVSEDYVHRIGRTGRAGSDGEAISLVSADEIKLLQGIERLIKKKITRTLVDGFEPVHDVPDAALDTRPIKAKKPKKYSPQGNDDKNKRNSRRKPGQSKNMRRPIKGSTAAQGKGKKPNKKTAVKATNKSTKSSGKDPYAHFRKK